MQYWISPSSIHLSLEEKLEAAGLKPLSQANVDIDPREILLIYSTPDQVLEKRRIDESTAISSNDLLTLYENTLSLSKKYRKIASSWRLNLLDTTSICRLCNNENPLLDKNIQLPSISPLAGLMTSEIIKKEPKVVDIYLDLELSSYLFGLDADSSYLQRLNACSLIDLSLMDWWEMNLDREASYEEVVNNLAQLTQIQNDYDRLVVEIDELRQSLIRQRATSTLRSKENKDLKSKVNLLAKEKKELSQSMDIMMSKYTTEDIKGSKQNRNHQLVKQSKIEGYESTTSIKSANNDRSTSLPVMLAKRFINIRNRNTQ